jgi:hypothetical protein
VYADKSEIYEWLKSTFSPIWEDPKCGDGACSQQTEFPGFGRFGCTPDCGAYTHLTTVHVEITPEYTTREEDSDTNPRTSFLSLTSWNFCTTELFPSNEEVCWYARDNFFTNTVGTLETWTLAVPGLTWYVRLAAPSGGTAGKVYVVNPDTGLKEVQYTWNFCAVTGPVARTNPGGFTYSLYTKAGVTAVAPPPQSLQPSPPPPLPPMVAAIQALVSLTGYTVSSFRTSEKAAFVVGMSAALSVRGDRIAVDDVTDSIVDSAASGLKRRRLLESESTSGVDVKFSVAAGSFAEAQG